MRYLLDTHALIWWWLGDPSLSWPAREAIEDDDSRLSVSAVSIYEIANKVRRGQLPILAELLANLDEELARDRIDLVPLLPGQALRAGLMAGDHRDPFDRMIAAQGLVDEMMVITRDRQIAAFGCETLW